MRVGDQGPGESRKGSNLQVVISRQEVKDEPGQREGGRAETVFPYKNEEFV